jgi:nucleoside-diphosphate kinase
MFSYTLGIIKPDAVERNLCGKILAMIEERGFKIAGMKMVKLSKEDAKEFYRVHEGKEFYESLSNYMSSAVIVALLLNKENAIEDFRKLMGATNPAKAEEGTIRKQFGLNIERNSIHGSDSEETAKREILFFFSRYELSQLGIRGVEI